LRGRVKRRAWFWHAVPGRLALIHARIDLVEQIRVRFVIL
jgi:hypothetical protein